MFENLHVKKGNYCVACVIRTFMEGVKKKVSKHFVCKTDAFITNQPNIEKHFENLVDKLINVASTCFFIDAVDINGCRRSLFHYLLTWDLNELVQLLKLGISYLRY